MSVVFPISIFSLIEWLLFVQVRVSQELDEIEHQQAPPVRTRKFTNEGLLTKEVVRARVVNELLETEKAYVKNIKDVVEVRICQSKFLITMKTSL